MEFLYPDLSYKLRGAFFTVYKSLGGLHQEIVYQKALASELTKRKISFSREVSLPVIYNNEIVGKYRPDFVVENKIIVEVKATELNSKQFEQQLFHYLAGSNYRLAFLVNFKNPNKVYVKRWVIPEAK